MSKPKDSLAQGGRSADYLNSEVSAGLSDIAWDLATMPPPEFRKKWGMSKPEYDRLLAEYKAGEI